MKFINNNQTYTAVLVGKDFVPEGLKKGLAMFQILDGEGEKVIGCISFGISLLTASTGSQIDKELFSGQNSELTFISLLSHLPLDSEKITKLYNEKNCWCFAYFFDYQHADGFSEDGETYFIKVEDGFYKTAQRLIFQGQVTNKKIQRKILEILYCHWEENPDTNLLIKSIQAMVPIDTTALERNLKFLCDEDKILILSEPSDQTKIISAKIKIEGIKEIEGEIEPSLKPAVEYIMGDKIQATTTGNQSPVIIKSQNVNLAFGDITVEIENKVVNETDKKELLFLVNELQQEVNGDKNPEKITGLLKQIKDKASWVNEKILSHPFLSQFFAIVLAKSLNLT